MSILKITKRANRFPQIIAATPKAADFLAQKHANRWMVAMIPLMSEDTGAMKRSTEIVKIATAHYGLQIGAFYWVYQNFGTVYIVGLFFVEESLEQIRKAFNDDLKNFLKYVSQFM